MSGTPHISSGYGSSSGLGPAGSSPFGPYQSDQSQRGADRTGRRSRSRSDDTDQASSAQASKSPTLVSQTKTTTDSQASAFKLTVQTADGDTVELSIEAQNVHQASNAYSSNSQGKSLQHTDSQGSAVQASIKVTGNLSDAEVSDIKSLLSSIGSDGSPNTQALPDNSTSVITNSSASTPAPSTASSGTPSTIASYSYSLTRVHQVTSSSVSTYA